MDDAEFQKLLQSMKSDPWGREASQLLRELAMQHRDESDRIGDFMVDKKMRQAEDLIDSAFEE